MPTFMKDEAPFSLTVQMTLHTNDGTIHRMRKIGKVQTSTYVEAGNFFLEIHTTNSSLAKATLDIAGLKRLQRKFQYSLLTFLIEGLTL